MVEKIRETGGEKGRYGEKAAGSLLKSETTGKDLGLRKN